MAITPIQLSLKSKGQIDFLFIDTPIAGVCNYSMFCCTLLNVHSSFAHLDGEERAGCFALVCLPGVS